MVVAGDHGGQVVEVVELALYEAIGALGDHRGRCDRKAAAKNVEPLVRHWPNATALAVVTEPGVIAAGGGARDQRCAPVDAQGIGERALVGTVNIEQRDFGATSAREAEGVGARELAHEFCAAAKAG